MSSVGTNVLRTQNHRQGSWKVSRDELTHGCFGLLSGTMRGIKNTSVSSFKAINYFFRFCFVHSTPLLNSSGAPLIVGRILNVVQAQGLIPASCLLLHFKTFLQSPESSHKRRKMFYFSVSLLWTHDYHTFIFSGLSIIPTSLSNYAALQNCSRYVSQHADETRGGLWISIWNG